MILWLDAQLSPNLATWIQKTFEIEAIAVRDLGLKDAMDKTIFMAAKAQSVVVMTKDKDFLQLQDQYGTPPKIIWLACGNTSNERLQKILSNALPKAINLLKASEPLVEIA